MWIKRHCETCDTDSEFFGNEGSTKPCGVCQHREQLSQYGVADELREFRCAACLKPFMYDRTVKMNMCPSCQKPKVLGKPNVKEGRVFISREYGYEDAGRIKELERRVILPYSGPNGEYYVGRKADNGKIEEREPDY